MFKGTLFNLRSHVKIFNLMKSFTILLDLDKVNRYTYNNNLILVDGVDNNQSKIIRILTIIDSSY